MNLPPELERDIDQQVEKYITASELHLREFCYKPDEAYTALMKFKSNCIRHGMSLMLRRVLEDLRSEDVDKFADHYFNCNSCLPEPTQLADWLESRYAKKESEADEVHKM